MEAKIAFQEQYEINLKEEKQRNKKLEDELSNKEKEAEKLKKEYKEKQEKLQLNLNDALSDINNIKYYYEDTKNELNTKVQKIDELSKDLNAYKIKNQDDIEN